MPLSWAFLFQSRGTTPALLSSEAYLQICDSIAPSSNLVVAQYKGFVDIIAALQLYALYVPKCSRKA